MDFSYAAHYVTDLGTKLYLVWYGMVCGGMVEVWYGMVCGGMVEVWCGMVWCVVV